MVEPGPETGTENRPALFQFLILCHHHSSTLAPKIPGLIHLSEAVSQLPTFNDVSRPPSRRHGQNTSLDRQHRSPLLRRRGCFSIAWTGLRVRPQQFSISHACRRVPSATHCRLRPVLLRKVVVRVPTIMACGIV